MNITTGETTCANGMNAFIAHPETGRHPALILIHERYGLVDHTRDLARRAAADGFFVLAPNFFFRHSDQAALNAGTARYDLTDPEAVENFRAARAALPANANPDRLAVAGYCQTGRHPIVIGAAETITAAIVWYGAASAREWGVTNRQPEPLEDHIARLSCPIFGAFGSADHIIAVADVRRLREALETHDKSYDIHIYADAPHGWLNDTMPGRHRKAQADAAWAAQQRFLESVFAGAWRTNRKTWRFAADIPADYDFSKNRRLA